MFLKLDVCIIEIQFCTYKKRYIFFTNALKRKIKLVDQIQLKK